MVGEVYVCWVHLKFIAGRTSPIKTRPGSARMLKSKQRRRSVLFVRILQIQ